MQQSVVRETVQQARVTSQLSPGVPPLTLQFSQSGTVTVVSGTHRAYVERDGTLALLRVALGTAATGSTTIAVRVNGTQVASASIVSGTYTITSSTTIALHAGDYLTVDVTAAGSTPGSDLTVTLTIN